MSEPRLAKAPNHVVYAVIEEGIGGDNVGFAWCPHRRNGAGTVGELEEPFADRSRQNVVRFPNGGAHVGAVTPRGAPRRGRWKGDGESVLGTPWSLLSAARWRKLVVCGTGGTLCVRAVAPQRSLREHGGARMA